MAHLDFLERRKISQLLNSGGYVLDFTNASYRKFVIEKTGTDYFSKYGGSKGKNLEEVIEKEGDSIVGKLLMELLNYMRQIGKVDDENRDLFNECVEIGYRLLGKQIKLVSPTSHQKSEENCNLFDYAKYKQYLLQLSELDETAQQRGYSFEKYLFTLFEASSLDPRGSFKIVGEQIDGSFILYNEVYLLEAKWTNKPIAKADLIGFNTKVISKSGITRGLFISYSGFTEEAIQTLSCGTTINIILMTVTELAICLERCCHPKTLIWKKVRALAEEGAYYKDVSEI